MKPILPQLCRIRTPAQAYVLDSTVNQQAAMSAFSQMYVLFALAVLVMLLAVPVMVSGHIATGSTVSH